MAAWCAKKELELKAKEIDATVKKLHSELEVLQQTQFTEILKKRLEVYPKIWEIVMTHTLNWQSNNKVRDYQWVKEFLEQLTACSAEVGVFFSQAVYVRYIDLENILINLEKKLSEGVKVEEFELFMPDRIFVGENNDGGLATFLKDDLGSYRDAIIQARNYIPKSINRKKDYQGRNISNKFTTSNESDNDMTLDALPASFGLFGRLIVVNSDDASMIDTYYDINNKLVTLGRKADNDIVFSKDSAVSRNHACIEEREGRIFLYEVKDLVTSTYPVYGTFVNDNKVGLQFVLLQDGDLIRLGKRVVLQYLARVE